jgi:hypothetical protein
MKTRPERDPLQTAHCIYSIPCECGRSYVGETSRPLAVQLREHSHSLKEGLLEKWKLAQHVCEEGHRVSWNEARIWEIESNSRYRKYKESAHMACLISLVSQPSLDISPIRIPFISNEVTNPQRRSVWCDRFFMGLRCSVFASQMAWEVGILWCQAGWALPRSFLYL